MSDVLPQLGLVFVLVIVNAAFAGTELALVSLREGQLQRLENRSSTGAILARLARQPNQFLSTIQIGITLAGFLASAAAAVSLAEPLEEPLGFLGGAAGPASIIVVTLLLSYVTLVFVLDGGWSCDRALRALAESGHTRAPVATGRNLDDVTGMVHMRQLLGAGDVPVSTITTELPVFPDAARVLTTMRELQTQRAQMALINEHGGTEGIVTMEDLIEELVGEIYDETDRDLTSTHNTTEETR